MVNMAAGSMLTNITPACTLYVSLCLSTFKYKFISTCRAPLLSAWAREFVWKIVWPPCIACFVAEWFAPDLSPEDFVPGGLEAYLRSNKKQLHSVCQASDKFQAKHT